jgi:hypothetical protein
MNEQLKELAYKSGLLSKLVFDDSWVPNPKLEAKLKKFAELIAVEYVTICTPDISGRLDGRPYETADEFDRGFIDGQDCCVELIKKHFGVEE